LEILILKVVSGAVLKQISKETWQNLCLLNDGWVLNLYACSYSISFSSWS